jgi:hypothetical protein
MFYIYLFEYYSFTELNICRYCQIVRNQNIYETHRRKLILSSIIVPLLILLNFIIQDIFVWFIVVEKPGSSCAVMYTNIFLYELEILLLFYSHAYVHQSFHAISSFEFFIQFGLLYGCHGCV